MKNNSAWKSNTVVPELVKKLCTFYVRWGLSIFHTDLQLQGMFLCTPCYESISRSISPTYGFAQLHKQGILPRDIFLCPVSATYGSGVAKTAQNVPTSNVSNTRVCVVTLAGYVLCTSAGYVFARISSMRFGHMKIVQFCAYAFRK
jgi:hypothetical protein